MLCFSLQRAKDQVEKALADDLDFPRVVIVIEDLVHKANVELASRHPAGTVRLLPRRQV